MVNWIIALVLVGVALWAIGQFPIDPTLYQIIRVVLIVVAVIIAIKLIVLLLGGSLAFG